MRSISGSNSCSDQKATSDLTEEVICIDDEEADAAIITKEKRQGLVMRPPSKKTIFVPSLEESASFLENFKKRSYKAYKKDNSGADISEDEEHVRPRKRATDPSEAVYYYQPIYDPSWGYWPPILLPPHQYNYQLVPTPYIPSLIPPHHVQRKTHRSSTRSEKPKSSGLSRKKQNKDKISVQYPVKDDSDDIEAKRSLLDDMFSQDIVHSYGDNDKERLSVFIKETHRGRKVKRPLNIYFMFRMDIRTLVDRFARLHQSPITKEDNLFDILKRCCEVVPYFKQGVYSGNEKTSACTRRWEELKTKSPELVKNFELLELEMKQLYAASFNFGTSDS